MITGASGISILKFFDLNNKYIETINKIIEIKKNKYMNLELERLSHNAINNFTSPIPIDPFIMETMQVRSIINTATKKSRLIEIFKLGIEIRIKNITYLFGIILSWMSIIDTNNKVEKTM